MSKFKDFLTEQSKLINKDIMLENKYPSTSRDIKLENLKLYQYLHHFYM